jgi:hypothetical protein
MPTKPGGQTIAFTSIRVIAADGEIGRTSFERCFPALAQIPLRTVEPGLANQPLGLRAIRLVLMLHYPLTHLGRCFAGRFGMETRMTDGSIQVNEQTAYSGGHQRRRKCRCQRSSHDERDGIVAAVRFQQPLLPMKQVADTTRESVAAVLAGDHGGSSLTGLPLSTSRPSGAAAPDSMFSGLPSPGSAVG